MAPWEPRATTSAASETVRDRDCSLSCELARDAVASYVCTGSCGERVTFGMGEVLRPCDVPAGACPRFRAELLAAFGAGGSRRFVQDRQVESVIPGELGAVLGQPYQDALMAITGIMPNRH
jgi:hypothetical protein